jgi:hypothetical protein
MSYAAHHKDFGSFVSHKVPANSEAIAKKPSILRRIFDAIMESRQREADRQIARFLAGRGGTLTDDLEREITRRLLTSDFGVNGQPCNDRRFP